MRLIGPSQGNLHQRISPSCSLEGMITFDIKMSPSYYTEMPKIFFYNEESNETAVGVIVTYRPNKDSLKANMML